MAIKTPNSFNYDLNILICEKLKNTVNFETKVRINIMEKYIDLNLSTEKQFCGKRTVSENDNLQVNRENKRQKIGFPINFGKDVVDKIIDQKTTKCKIIFDGQRYEHIEILTNPQQINHSVWFDKLLLIQNPYNCGFVNSTCPCVIDVRNIVYNRTDDFHWVTYLEEQLDYLQQINNTNINSIIFVLGGNTKLINLHWKQLASLCYVIKRPYMILAPSTFIKNGDDNIVWACAAILKGFIISNDKMNKRNDLGYIKVIPLSDHNINTFMKKMYTTLEECDVLSCSDSSLLRFPSIVEL